MKGWEPSVSWNALGERNVPMDESYVPTGMTPLRSEMKWTTRRLERTVVDDLYNHKLPALVQAGFRLADPAAIVLFSKSGYSNRLKKMAELDENSACGRCGIARRVRVGDLGWSRSRWFTLQM